MSPFDEAISQFSEGQVSWNHYFQTFSDLKGPGKPKKSIKKFSPEKSYPPHTRPLCGGVGVHCRVLRWDLRVAHFVGILWKRKNQDCPPQSSLYLSPVAEFGGTLGLFLGFSFLNLWDVVEIAASVFPALFKSFKSFMNWQVFHHIHCHESLGWRRNYCYCQF